MRFLTQYSNYVFFNALDNIFESLSHSVFTDRNVIYTFAWNYINALKRTDIGRSYRRFILIWSIPTLYIIEKNKTSNKLLKYVMRESKNIMPNTSSQLPLRRDYLMFESNICTMNAWQVYRHKTVAEFFY